MQELSEGKILPINKFKPLLRGKDKFNEYEIKTKNLRVYLFHEPGIGRIIICGGKKSNQEKDIRHFRNVMHSYIHKKNGKIMLSKKELIKTPEYWLEKLQNEIFRQVHAYMDKEGLNQSQLAIRLGVSKGYISQVLNGNFNFSIRKLVELSLSIGVVPEIRFQPSQATNNRNLYNTISKNKKRTLVANVHETDSYYPEGEINEFHDGQEK